MKNYLLIVDGFAVTIAEFYPEEVRGVEAADADIHFLEPTPENMAAYNVA